MKTRLSLLLVLLIGAAPVLAGAPKFVARQNVYDFGTIKEGQKVIHDFIVENGGEEQLVFDASGTCDCTTIVISATQVAPGATTSIRFIYDSKNVDGHDEESLKVVTNDPQLPLATLTLRGEVNRTFVVDPSVLSFGAIGRDERATRTIRISAKDMTGELKISQIGCERPEIKTQVKSGSDEHEKVIEVAVDALALPPGRLETKLDLHTNYGERGVIQVPVDVEVKGSIRVEPEILALRRLDAGAGGAGTVTVSALDEVTRFHITGTEYLLDTGQEPQVTVQESKAAQAYQITVKFTPGLTAGFHRGQVKLKTDNPQQPEVTFMVNARAR